MKTGLPTGRGGTNRRSAPTLTLSLEGEGKGRRRSGSRVVVSILLGALGTAAVLVATPAAFSKRAEAASLSDPTRPYRSRAGRVATEAAPALVLQSTLVSPGRKVAVINGKRLRIGDNYDGAVVTEITPYEVRLSKGGREMNLRLLPKLIKRKGAVE